MSTDDDIKDCCADLNNRGETDESDQPSPMGDLTISTCQVCGCRHFELTVDPGKLGLLGATL